MSADACDAAYRDLACLVTDAIIAEPASHITDLVEDLMVAAFYVADHGGLGSDRVIEIAREIRKMQEAKDA
jgi:hypothetical protein